MQFFNSSSFNSCGTARISFDLSETFTSPSVRRFSRAHALTTCMASLPRSCERRTVFPSIATTSLGLSSTICLTHLRNDSSNAAGCSNAKTRPNVSWLGIPCGNSKYCLNQFSRDSPNSSISVNSSAPHSTADKAMNRISSSLWRCPCERRGSGRSEKLSKNTSISLLSPMACTPFLNHPGGTCPKNTYFSFLSSSPPLPVECDCPDQAATSERCSFEKVATPNPVTILISSVVEEINLVIAVALRNQNSTLGRESSSIFNKNGQLRYVCYST